MAVNAQDIQDIVIAATNALQQTRRQNRGVPAVPTNYPAWIAMAFPSSIAATSDLIQKGTRLKPVNKPPAVRLFDQGHKPLSGVRVNFEIGEGNGSVRGSAQTTNDDGLATVEQWILGPAVGTNTLIAFAEGLESEQIVFVATAFKDPGAETTDHLPNETA